MESSSAPLKLPGGGLRRLLGTRNGTILVAAVAAGVALLVLLSFMKQYRESVAAAPVNAIVLVSKRAINKGTAGDVIAGRKMYTVKSVRSEDAVLGVFADVSALRGQVATRDIAPGQQLALGDFKLGADPITNKLAGRQRAISVPVDSEHGNIGQVTAGSRVDVIGAIKGKGSGNGADAIIVLAQNALVLKAPEPAQAGSSSSGGFGGGAASGGKSVVLRLMDRDARRVALVSETGKIWLLIRPPAFSRESRQQPITGLDLVTREQLLRLKHQVKQFADTLDEKK
jgi:Flp pilus assembly protein CpaB